MTRSAEDDGLVLRSDATQGATALTAETGDDKIVTIICSFDAVMALVKERNDLRRENIELRRVIAETLDILTGIHDHDWRYL